MTSPAPRASDAYTREERREREFALRTDAVVLATSLAALVAFGASWFVLDGVGRWSDALVLALVAGISNLARRDSRRGRGLSLTGAIMLAAIPLGAGLGIPLIAIVGAAANWRSVGAQRIVFNAATGCLAGVLAAMVYVILGAPVVPAAALGETRGLIQMGLGLVVGIIVQALTTATLVAGVLWASRGISMRTTMRGLFRESGLDYLATIGLAFLIVVTWVPVGAGAVSVVLLAPIFVVSRFAVAQWSNEWTAQVRAVSAFTTAMDERHPGAAVHAADVARICEWIADELAMSSVDAQALGLAGALQGIDSLALPNGSGRRSAISALDSVDVLAPALPILQRYRDPDDGVGRPLRPARVLAVADAYARVRARDVPAGAREPHLLAYGRLLEQQDDRFDPSVVAALGRVLERVDPLDRGIARSAETVAGDPGTSG